ncbi:MAG: hypothetical protein QG597_5158 [Actinomycetota bacterium]|nr:hypothetical protein [Actinomycetota bacterium]
MIQGIQITADGDISEVAVDHGYKALQAVVGGVIEAVSSRSGQTTLWAHEEAKIIGLPANPVGTLAWWLLNPAARGRDYLSGTVLITGGADAEGRTLSIGAEGLAAVALIANRAQQRSA